MPIAGYRKKTETVYVDEQFDFTVRALNLTDLAFMVEVHRDDLQALYMLLQARQQLPGDQFFDISVAVDIIREFIQTAPAVVATILALCSDEPNVGETMQAMAVLPIPIQSEALQRIAALTFTDTVKLKNFVAGTWKMIESLVPADMAEKVASHLKNGSTEAGATLEKAPAS